MGEQDLMFWIIAVIMVIVFGSIARDLFAGGGGREVVVGAKGESGKVFEREVKAIFVGNYDGDTLTVHIPEWPQIIGNNIGVRIANIDTPEVRGTDGKEKAAAEEAKSYIAKICRAAPNKTILLRNIRRDKYFRILADVECNGTDLGLELIKRRLAVPYDGGKKQQWNFR